MIAAPAFNCMDCHRRIGKAAPHWLITADGTEVGGAPPMTRDQRYRCVLLCTRCANRRDDSRWCASRAATAHALGLWDAGSKHTDPPMDWPPPGTGMR